MSVFQVIFGLTVFAITRHYYSQEANPAAPVQSASHVTGANSSGNTPGSELEQLLELNQA